MKKIKPTKKQSLAAIAILCTLGIFVALAMLLSSQNTMRTDIDNLRSTIESQKKELAIAQNDIKSINANNGTALQVCLDNAAKAYNNTLKSTGIIKEENGTRVTYHDYDVWQKTLDTLNNSRAHCNEQFE